MATTGQRIREGYEAKGMNRAEFARKLGAQYHQVTSWEKGQMPNPARLAEIAQVLDVPIDWLLCREPRIDTSDGSDGPTAPEDVVDRVIADVGLDSELAALLRRHRWDVGIPSEGTLRSLALDMKSAKRRAAEEAPATKKEPNGFMARGKKR